MFIICSDDVTIFDAVSHPARRRIKLQRRPRASLAFLFVDGERFGHGSVETKAHVSDVESLAQVEREIDAVGILDVLQHGL